MMEEVTAPRRVQRFEVIGHLGTGGMGSVFRARDPQLERDVAIKLLAQTTGFPKQLSENETLDLRTDAPASADDLLREARMMARLSHPNVLPVYEVGLAGDAVFVVMEHIDGSDLRVWLAEPRTIAEIIEVFSQAGRGLAAAHANAIVHRDFKPENVLVGRDGRVRVADFGLSRLTVRPLHAMRRVDDSGGTPRYMAPEIWRGDAATTQSDVFAFCVAFAEAFGADRGDKLEAVLRDRDVPPQLRAALAAGLSEDPSARPSLETILATIGGRSGRPARWMLVSGGTAAIAIGVVVALVMSGGASAPSCDADPTFAAGRWDTTKRAMLRSFLEPTPQTPASHASIERIITTFDDVQRAIGDSWTATCVAARDGTLTDTQASLRRSCLERRQVELGAKVDQFMRLRRTEFSDLVDRARTFPDVTDCTEIVVPPFRDRSAVLALYYRLAAVEDLRGPARLAEFEALARDAGAIGEREVEARGHINLGIRLADVDKLKDGDEELQRGYRIVLDIHSLRLQAFALIMRSRNANQRGDVREAMSLADVALALAEKPTASAATRARVYSELGHVALERGDTPGALDKINKGLEIVAKDNHRLPFIEAGLRFDRASALGSTEGKLDEALASTREMVEWMRTTFGEHSSNYASGLSMLATVLDRTGDQEAVLAARQQALAIVRETEPPTSARILMEEGNLADALERVGRFEEARRGWAAELAGMKNNEMLRKWEPLATLHLGITTCQIGRCDEGYPLVERAIELGTAAYGPDHRYTVQYRGRILDLQLELGKLDEAERTIAALDRGYRAQAGPHERSLALLDGIFRAQLAYYRGKFRKAEVMVRAGLAAWDELHGDDRARGVLLETLASVLIEQHRWTEAATVLDQYDALHVKGGNDASAAVHEIMRAQIDAGLGRRAEAIERAKRAREVLERFPMDIRSRKDADELIGPKSVVTTPPAMKRK
jgi:tetratricopeptide (TPR) repeat protein